VEVLMPQLGETVNEGKITSWFKSVGDRVKAGDTLFEIETDKVSMELPSISAGVLSEIRVRAGEVASVGAVVRIIAESGDTSTAPNNNRAASSLDPALQKSRFELQPYMEVRTPERGFGPAKLGSGVSVTPLARRLAAESGIDLSHFRGSGPDGRIVAKDIQGVILVRSVSPVPRFVPQSSAPPSPGIHSRSAIRDAYANVPHEEVPLDNMRRIIAERLTKAASTIPQFHVSSDIEIDRLLAIREEANASLATSGNSSFKLSINDFVVRAFAVALQRVPAANAIWAEDRILRFMHSDIGVAVATDGGLLMPVIRDAETKPVSVISGIMKDLAARGRARKLLPQEYQAVPLQSRTWGCMEYVLFRPS